MPRYQYGCSACGLVDVKTIIYKSDEPDIAGAEYRACPDCGTMLERKFLRPPQGWFNQQRQGNG